MKTEESRDRISAAYDKNGMPVTHYKNQLGNDVALYPDGTSYEYTSAGNVDYVRASDGREFTVGTNMNGEKVFFGNDGSKYIERKDAMGSPVIFKQGDDVSGGIGFGPVTPLTDFDFYADPYANVTPAQVAAYQKNQKAKQIQRDKETLSRQTKAVPKMLRLTHLAVMIAALIAGLTVIVRYTNCLIFTPFFREIVLTIPLVFFLITVITSRKYRGGEHELRLLSMKQCQNVLFAAATFVLMLTLEAGGGFFYDYTRYLMVVLAADLVLAFISYTFIIFFAYYNPVVTVPVIITNLAAALTALSYHNLTFDEVMGRRTFFVAVFALQLAEGILPLLMEKAGRAMEVHGAKKRMNKLAAEQEKEARKRAAEEQEWLKDPRYTTLSFDVEIGTEEKKDLSVFPDADIMTVRDLAELVAPVVKRPEDHYTIDALRAGHRVSYDLPLGGWIIGKSGYIQEDFINDAMETPYAVAQNSKIYVLLRDGRLAAYSIDYDIYLNNRPAYYDRPLRIRRDPFPFDSSTAFFCNRPDVRRWRTEDDREINDNTSFDQPGERLGDTPGQGIMKILTELM